jgi:arabinogalactan endo-1,4-beta-galactosidase
MKISSAFPSDYLKASDLQGNAVTVTMAHVSMEAVGKDQKPILYFQGKERGLVLNKTNASKISEMYGDDTDNWTGGKIILYEAMVDFKGDTVAAIRVRLAPRNGNSQTQTTPRTSSQSQPPDDRGHFSDDIPF